MMRDIVAQLAIGILMVAWGCVVLAAVPIKIWLASRQEKP